MPTKSCNSESIDACFIAMTSKGILNVSHNLNLLPWRRERNKVHRPMYASDRSLNDKEFLAQDLLQTPGDCKRILSNNFASSLSELGSDFNACVYDNFYKKECKRNSIKFIISKKENKSSD